MYGDPLHGIRPAEDLEQLDRHSAHAHRRLVTYEALCRVCERERALSAYAECGAGAWLQVSATGDDLRIVCDRCHHRWCPACAGERGRMVAANIESHLSGRSVRFLTLTLRHSQTPLTEQIDRLYRSFASLRRRPQWAASVEGGVAVLEVKISDRDGLWHPHLHVVMEGLWFDVREISRLWHGVTGDSSVVWIEGRGTDGSIARYLAKYLAKPAHDSVYRDPAKLEELIVTLRGRRLCFAFGTWRGWRILARPASDVKWLPVQSIVTLVDRARKGEVEARRWIEAVARKWPNRAAIFGWPQSGAP